MGESSTANRRSSARPFGRVDRSSDHRAAALSHRLDYQTTPLGDRPPISRVHNLHAQYI